MTLTFNKSEFEHITHLSFYNNNFYKHKKLDYVIYEVCYEDENYCELFLVGDSIDIFIGCYDTHDMNKEDIKIEFKKFFT